MFFSMICLLCRLCTECTLSDYRKVLCHPKSGLCAIQLLCTHCETCSFAMKRHTEISEYLKQRIVIKFLVKQGWNFTQIKTGLQNTFGTVLCDASVYKWIAQFQSGRTSVVDKLRASKPKTGCSMVKIRKVESLISQDRRITLRELALRANVPSSTVERIIKFDLKLKKKCAKWVPHLLTEAQKARRLAVCDFWVRLVDYTPHVLCRVITTDEAWIYVYDPQFKQQSKKWLRAGEPRPPQVRKEMATAKIMVVTFFDARGLIYYEYVQHPLTVNQHVFRAIFTRFHQAYMRRRPNSAIRGRHFIHIDNATPHTAILTRALINQLGWTQLPHPPYSPDLAPNDFWLYNRLKKNIRGIRFPTVNALKEAVSKEISMIPSREYQHAMLHSWRRRWARCQAAQGEYFEGMD